MTGETVLVRFPVKVGEDMARSPICEYDTDTQEVDNVLVAPGPRADVIESTRPEGVLVRYTLYFPKPFDRDLERARIDVRGGTCEVVGKPDFYSKAGIPTGWWLAAEVVDVHG